MQVQGPVPQMFREKDKNLWQISDADLKYFATSLNPEAGNHAVPAAEREIRAAMAAAQTCREAYPYFYVRNVWWMKINIIGNSQPHTKNGALKCT